MAIQYQTSHTHGLILTNLTSRTQLIVMAAYHESSPLGQVQGKNKTFAATYSSLSPEDPMVEDASVPMKVAAGSSWRILADPAGASVVEEAQT